ncbi:MAG: hypothetical protein CMJ58_08115 [Planctomycetaceae bacterium]|nr:hypothetical protein [Planctomycetaceae bacterium]
MFVVAAAVLAAASAQGQIINESLSGSNAVQPGVTPTPTAEESSGGPLSWMVPKVTLPKISMPKIEMPKMPTNALAPVKASAAKVKDGAKKAWEGTKEILSFGRNKQPDARVASRDQPSLLQRMFISEEPETRTSTNPLTDFVNQPRPQ